MGILARPLASFRRGIQSHERSSNIVVAACRKDTDMVPFLLFNLLACLGVFIYY